VLAVALAMALLVTGSGLVGLIQAKPHGDWDSWAIWNLRAKFLAGPGDSWKHAVSPLLERTHPYYPLLTAGWIAWVWKLGGGYTAYVPALTALLFTVSTLGLAIAFITMARGVVAALAAGLILVSSSAFLLETATQYADIPLAFYYAASILLTLVGGGRAWLLAGMFAGFAAWTKNEGAAFLVYLLLCHAVVSRNRGWKSMVLGALPGIALLLWFKAFLAPAGDPIFRQGAGELMGKITDPGRYAQIMKHAVLALGAFGSVFSHPLVLLAIAAIALGWKVREDERRLILASGLALALTFASYLAIYVIVPQDLVWRLETSMTRLYVHVWPAFLVLIFMASGGSPAPVEAVLVGAAVPRSPKRRRGRQSVKRP
jgi:hypothetical protein